MMKYTLVFLSILWFSSTVYAQIRFEPGYFIDNEGNRREVLIKNTDWRFNPVKFEYKGNPDDKANTAYLEEVQEFGIDNFSKYKRFAIEIDRSSDNLSDLSLGKAANLEQDTVFLNTLLEGKAELYTYEGKDFTRFYYRKDQGDLQYLIYKKYRASSSQMGENKFYRLQLWNDLKCEEIKQTDAENTEYKQKSLIRYFEKYNSCFGESHIPLSYDKKEKRDGFNLSIRPGISIAELDVQPEGNLPGGTFDSDIAYRIGLELEYVFPFNKNKWSLLLEPAFQSFETTQMVEGDQAIVDYQSFLISLGLRHYSFISRKSKVFINGLIVLDLVLDDSRITFDRNVFSTNYIDLISSGNFAIGLGYTFNNRVSLEARYNIRRDVLAADGDFDSVYNTYGIILGFNFF